MIRNQLPAYDENDIRRGRECKQQMDESRRRELYRYAHAAGWDAGNRSRDAAGREQWNDEDYSEAARTMTRVLGEVPNAQ